MNSKQLRLLVEKKIRQMLKEREVVDTVEEFSTLLATAVNALQGLSQAAGVDGSPVLDDEVRTKIEDLVRSLPSGGIE